MLLWSLVQVWRTDPGYVSNDPESQLSEPLIQQKRYCSKCELPKPLRAHHCKVCNRCVLKMDHHCPFVGNCIGHGNVKLFWNFLFYASLASAQVGIVTLATSSGEKMFLLGALSLSISVSTMFLLLNQTYMIINNTTLIEQKKPMKENPFDKGPKDNWVEVFGEGWFVRLAWLLPLK